MISKGSFVTVKPNEYDLEMKSWPAIVVDDSCFVNKKKCYLVESLVHGFSNPNYLLIKRLKDFKEISELEATLLKLSWLK